MVGLDGPRCGGVLSRCEVRAERVCECVPGTRPSERGEMLERASFLKCVPADWPPPLSLTLFSGESARSSRAGRHPVRCSHTPFSRVRRAPAHPCVRTACVCGCVCERARAVPHAPTRPCIPFTHHPGRRRRPRRRQRRRRWRPVRRRRRRCRPGRRPGRLRCLTQSRQAPAARAHRPGGVGGGADRQQQQRPSALNLLLPSLCRPRPGDGPEVPAVGEPVPRRADGERLPRGGPGPAGAAGVGVRGGRGRGEGVVG